MSGPDFFQTMMGRTFFEGTMPSIARNLAKIAEELKRSNAIREQQPSTTADQRREVVPLNSLQRMALKGYETGAFSALRSLGELEASGDTLILAIVRELEDTESTACARHRLQVMSAQLSHVIRAIDATDGQTQEARTRAAD